MENIKYCVDGAYKDENQQSHELEFFTVQTNECHPDYETRELGIRISVGGYGVMDYCFDQNDLNSLVGHLTRLRDYCADFNEKSKNSAQYKLPK